MSNGGNARPHAAVIKRQRGGKPRRFRRKPHPVQIIYNKADKKSREIAPVGYRRPHFKSDGLAITEAIFGKNLATAAVEAHL